jgi:two-component system sensor histidine kinase UhpB
MRGYELSLKLRLNIIVTTLLVILMIAGMVLNVVNARQNVRAEVESTEKLALYMFDADIEHSAVVTLQDASDKPFRLQRLRHMRHLAIEFRNRNGALLDSNRTSDEVEPWNQVPQWFERIMVAVNPKLESKERQVEYHGATIGRLVITPDPRYEYAEIWKQMTDLLTLLSIFFVMVNLMIAWAVGEALEPTTKILEALNDLEKGNLKARLPDFDLPELARIGEKFNHMVETLERSINRNHRLTQQLITLQEAERKSLARDLHDEFGQCLTAINTDATVISRVAETKSPEILESAKAISQISRHLMEIVSGLLERLRPGILDELGLDSALNDLVDTWRTRNEKVNCVLHCDKDLPSNFEESIQVTVYRMVQECLTNIARHTFATNVEVIVSLDKSNPDAKSLCVEVRDNGRGFDEKNVDGFGLAGMRERLEGLGGKFFLESVIGKGTKVFGFIPLKEVNHDK